MPMENSNAAFSLARILRTKRWNTWDIWEIIGISDKRWRRFRQEFRFKYARVVALLVGRRAIGLPLRRFGCGRIVQFPPGYLATRLLLVGRQRGSSMRSSP